MRLLGLIVIGIGLIWAVIAFQMSTSVMVGHSSIGSGEYSIASVNNIGLLQERSNHLLLAGLTVLVGVVLFGMGTLKQSNVTSSDADTRKCPHCAELVKVEAKVCRFCQRGLPPLKAPPETAVAARLAADHRKTCPFCDAKIVQGAKKCPSCSTELSAEMFESNEG